MTIWQDSLNAIYDSDIAVDAVLSAGTAGGDQAFRMIDKTVGIAVGDADDPQATTILPATYIRMSELTAKGLSRQDLDGSTVTIGGRDWRVKSHLLRPCPDGELAGEVCLFLIGGPPNG